MKIIPMLTVFMATALATTIAMVLPFGRTFGLLLDFVPVGGVITATAFATTSFRRMSPPLTRLLVAVYGYFVGGLVGAFGVAHTVAVIITSIERARQNSFAYTFHFYSLVLLGVLLVVAGLIATIAAEPLARGHRAGWRASLSVWAAILVINLPLVPLQGFAVLFSVLAGLALLLLTGTRRNFSHECRTQPQHVE